MKTVLFVDDNRLLCRIGCDILRRQGYRAVPVFSAAEALQAFANEPFDVLVTDWKMEGMDGLELARELRRRAPGLPIIVVSAYDPIECDAVDEWLPKEELFPKLVERIESYMAALKR